MTLRTSLDRLEAELGRWGVPAAEVAVVRAGEVLAADAFGVRGVDDPKPVGPATWFHHGSCGKAFTGLVAAALAEEGLLDLDAPVRRYLPELRLLDPNVADLVTTRDLLAHCSGLGRHDLVWILDPGLTGAELLERLAHLPLAADLRARWLYSNLGYALAGLVIGRATDSTWDEQLRTRVLEPCGMTRTSSDLPRVLADDDHAGAHARRGERTVTTTFRPGPEVIAPAGGILSCAEDSARWLLAQTGTGADTPLARAVKVTHQPQMLLPTGVSPHPEVNFQSYGLGWVVGTAWGRPIVWHNGGIDGFHTDLLLLPEERIGVLVSTNVYGQQLSLAAVLALTASLIDEGEPEAWYDRLRPNADPDETDAAASGPVERDAAERNATGTSHPPAHPPGEYAGSYENPGFGTIEVTSSGSELSIRMAASELRCTHRHFETWDLLYEPLETPLTATFSADAEGKVTDVVVPLEPELEPVRFRRIKKEGTSKA